MPEPTIYINGERLTEGEAMTVRVAIENFAGDLMDGLGDDEHGLKMTALYQQAIESIRLAMRTE